MTYQSQERAERLKEIEESFRALKERFIIGWNWEPSMEWLISEFRAMQEELAAFNVAPSSEQLTHSRNCAAWSVGGESACTCGLSDRIRTQTAETVSAAWRKRATEAETELALLRKPLEGDEAKVVEDAKWFTDRETYPIAIRSALNLLESTLRDNRRMLAMVELQGFDRDGARACGEALDARKKRIAELEDKVVVAQDVATEEAMKGAELEGEVERLKAELDYEDQQKAGESY